MQKLALRSVPFYDGEKLYTNDSEGRNRKGQQKHKGCSALMRGKNLNLFIEFQIELLAPLRSIEFLIRC